MPMSRDDAAAFISGSLGPMLAVAGVGTDDLAGELKEPIDEALLLLGVGFDDLATASVDSTSVVAYRAVLTYTALEKLYAAVLPFATVSKSLGSPSVSKSEQRGQITANVKAALDAARTKAEGFVTITDANSWQAPARLGLDTYNKPYLGELGYLIENPVGW